MSTNKQVNKSKTTHVRLDRGMVRLAKIYAAKHGETIRSVIEGRMGDIWEPENDKTAS